MTTTRVLFVDDETRVLEGLQRMLRSRRHEWEMEFANDAPTALEACARTPFDVVVSDMRMPGMDGAALLTEVQRRHPDTVRIVLSGHADRAGAARVARVAHQHLTKPTDAAGLTETIDRACRLRDTLAHAGVSSLIGRLTWLPALPPIYRELLAAMDQPGAQPVAIARSVAADTELARRVLDLVNSTRFGASRHMTTLQTAATLVGVDFIASLVLAAELFREYEQHLDDGRTDKLRTHSLCVADLAATMANDGQRWESAYVAGLLHDLGRLALLAGLPEEYAAVERRAERNPVSLLEAERAALGATHAQVGAALLRRWRVPEAIVEAVAFHHSPSEIGAAAPMVPLAVHVADHLAHEAAPEQDEHGSSPLDLAALRSAGVEDRLPDWREMAGVFG